MGQTSARIIAFAFASLLLAAPASTQSTPQFSALVKNDNVQAVRKYLAGGGNPNAIEGPRDLTLLHWAAYHGSVGAARLLVEKGANVNARAKNPDWQPLHYAAARGFVPVASFLIDHGASIDGLTAEGLSPLAAAASDDRRETINLLLARNADGGIALARMVRSNRKDAVTRLLDHGVNADASPRNDDVGLGLERGQTSLFIAVEAGNIEMATLLLARGANPNAVHPNGGNMPTPLMIAAYFCDSAMIDLLVTKGAARSATNGSGATAGDLAQSGWTDDMRPCTASTVAKLR